MSSLDKVPALAWVGGTENFGVFPTEGCPVSNDYCLHHPDNEGTFKCRFFDGFDMDDEEGLLACAWVNCSYYHENPEERE